MSYSGYVSGYGPRAPSVRSGSGAISVPSTMSSTGARQFVPGSDLDTSITATEAGHLAAHVELRAAYLSRGTGRTLAVLNQTMTRTEFVDAHRAVHLALHAEHKTLGAAGDLPTVFLTTGHLQHHEILHAAHNARP